MIAVVAVERATINTTPGCVSIKIGGVALALAAPRRGDDETHVFVIVETLPILHF
jgi:hypothetical protein